MDEAPCSSNALPPFLTKTYEMVDESSTDSVVSWSPSNGSFIVWNPPELSKDLLPKYFKHNNFSSFIRQLNTYGFRKVDPEQWEFANEGFVRGQPHLLKNIHRRKPVYSHSLQKLAGQGALQLSESERQKYKNEIEMLKCDKESFLLELQSRKQENEKLEMQMQVLTERLQHVKQRQKNTLSSLAQTLHKPAIAFNLIPQPDIHDRRRRFPENNYSDNDTLMEDSQVSSSRRTRENLDATSPLVLNKELIGQIESSLIYWENIFVEVGQACTGHNLSLELEESTSCANSPAISYTQLNVDRGSKTLEIDINSETNTSVVPESAASKEKIAGTATNFATGINDVFWAQFLTENPGSTSALEVKSARKDPDGKDGES